MSTVASAQSSRAREACSSSAYVLHTFAFRETSLIVEMFTRSHGRMGLVAKGARRPRSAMRGQLMAFQPLRTTWSGKSELKVLHGVEWEAGHRQLQGVQLMCGFYLNELLLKLLQREDAHEGLYHAYEQALTTLRSGVKPAKALRRFERELLRELGYALMLEHDVEGVPIDPQAGYDFQIERGPVMLSGGGVPAGLAVRGSTLLKLARSDGELRDIEQERAPEGAPEKDELEQEGRALMRHVIAHYLNGQELSTRQLLRELQEL